MNRKMSNLLLEPDAIKLLESYGIPYPKYRYIRNKIELSDSADLFSYPVVLKVVSPQIIHKSDAGGVKVNLTSYIELCRAYEEIHSSVQKYNPNANIEGMIVVQQAEIGEDMIVGMLEDEIFGKTIMFGTGGILTELFEDVTFRVCPVDKRNAEEMIKEVKGRYLLEGYRGRKKTDVKSLIDLIVSVSDMCLENEDIQEIDLNPVRLYKDGLLVLDARIMTSLLLNG